MSSSPSCPKVMLRGRNPSLLGRSSLNSGGRPVPDSLVLSFVPSLVPAVSQNRTLPLIQTWSLGSMNPGPRRNQNFFMGDSKVDGPSLRRKPCPTLHAGPWGSGFEIMVNLATATDTTCASKLLNRNVLGDNMI